MTRKPATSKKAIRPTPRAAAAAAAARRKEWRFDLPLRATVLGTLARGEAFQEPSKLMNISSTGAYLCLKAGVVVGSKLDFVIDLPREATDGKIVRLRIGGIVVRIEKRETAAKKQGVAVRFDKEFEFAPAGKK